jgi:hypothetical protein
MWGFILFPSVKCDISIEMFYFKKMCHSRILNSSLIFVFLLLFLVRTSSKIFLFLSFYNVHISELRFNTSANIMLQNFVSHSSSYFSNFIQCCHTFNKTNVTLFINLCFLLLQYYIPNNRQFALVPFFGY